MNGLKKNLKILLIPDKLLTYDLNQLEGIKNALDEFNIESHIFKSEYSDYKIKKYLNDNSFNIVFAINKGRPEKLNKKIRFISWFQDFYYNSDDLLENYQNSDIVYFYTSQESFGVSKNIECLTSTLYPGIDPSNVTSLLESVSYNQNEVDNYQKLDFSICGYMPGTILAPFIDLYFRNFDFKEKNFIDSYFIKWFLELTHKNEKKYKLDFYKKFIVDLQVIVETNYIPLSGNLNVKLIASKIKARIKEYFKYLNSQIFREWLPFFSTEYPRFLDRIELARLLSKHSFNFGLFGKEWLHFLEFESFAGAHISNTQDLFEVYRKSKINLYNNTHGLGMHSKVFEIFANGGFLALPKSIKNSSLGGINEGFNENEHFVTFTKENFEDLVNDWLFNTKKRIEIGKNARNVVINKHTWKNRVQKILKDLAI